MLRERHALRNTIKHVFRRSLQVYGNWRQQANERRHWRRTRRLKRGKDHEYQTYLDVQLRQTLGKKHKALPTGARYLIERLVECRPPTKDIAVLCVGCRNRNELDFLRSKGYGNVIGIDLYSDTRDILVMDMHEMSFPDRSFDIVYSSHSLEHARDPRQAAREFMRVARPGGTICVEVPVKYQTRGADIHDFGDAAGVTALFADCLAHLLHTEDAPIGSPTNGLSEPVARVILSIEKGAECNHA